MESADGNPNPILIKSEDFAVRIVKLARYLQRKQREYEMSRQIKRSGTSIGANIIEAHSGSSKRDFLAKLYIAFKECNETRYWLRVLRRTDYLQEMEFRSIYTDAEELSKLLGAIIKTTKANIAQDES